MELVEDYSIRELSASEINEINGGWGMVARILTTISIADALEDFASGFHAGYNA